MDKEVEIMFDQELFNSLEVGAYYVNTERQVQAWNKAAEEITGYMSDEVVGSHCFNNILMHIDESGTLLCNNKCPLAATMQDAAVREATVFFHHKTAGYRAKVYVITAPVFDRSNRIIGGVEVFIESGSREILIHSLEGLLQRKLLI